MLDMNDPKVVEFIFKVLTSVIVLDAKDLHLGSDTREFISRSIVQALAGIITAEEFASMLELCVTTASKVLERLTGDEIKAKTDAKTDAEIREVN